MIRDPREQVVLDISEAGIRVRKDNPGEKAQPIRDGIRGGDEIARLLIGSDDPDEVIEVGKIKLSGDARELAAILFPNQHPSLGTWDRF